MSFSRRGKQDIFMVFMNNHDDNLTIDDFMDIVYSMDIITYYGNLP